VLFGGRQRVPFEEHHLVARVRQHAARQQATDAGADDDRAMR
jgi:hypothetical protein